MLEVMYTVFYIVPLCNSCMKRALSYNNTVRNKVKHKFLITPFLSFVKIHICKIQDKIGSTNSKK